MSKRVVGGDYLLDLSSFEIEKSEDGTKTNITDADVLEQLTNLKKYVPNPNGIKPVWVKMKNGETDELIVARGTFANVGTGEFEICVLLNGYKLIISIEFTQALNEDEQPIDDWYIAENDAKYLFTSDYQRVVVANVKNIDGEILSQLQCGDVVIKHDESGEHSYVVTFKSETGICLTYTDASCVETQSYDYVDGTGWVYNSQDLSFINRMEQIVDAQGRNRFIEGNLELEEITGVSFTYGKWALSGNHLMIVLAGNIVGGTTLTTGKWAGVPLPLWIVNKLVATFSSVIAFISVGAYDSAWGGQNFTISLRKSTPTQISLVNESGTAISNDKGFRMSFDLLIDNE